MVDGVHCCLENHLKDKLKGCNQSLKVIGRCGYREGCDHLARTRTDHALYSLVNDQKRCGQLLYY